MRREAPHTLACRGGQRAGDPAGAWRPLRLEKFRDGADFGHSDIEVCVRTSLTWWDGVLCRTTTEDERMNTSSWRRTSGFLPAALSLDVATASGASAIRRVGRGTARSRVARRS